MLTRCQKGKDRYSPSWEPHLRATERHLPYGITQCYLPPDTSERAPPNPSHTQQRRSTQPSIPPLFVNRVPAFLLGLTHVNP